MTPHNVIKHEKVLIAQKKFFFKKTPLRHNALNAPWVVKKKPLRSLQENCPLGKTNQAKEKEKGFFIYILFLDKRKV